MEKIITSDKVHKIVNILSKDPVLVENRDMFWGSLGLPRECLQDVKADTLIHNSGAPSFLTETLHRWISNRGAGATFGSLIQVLNDGGYKNLGGQITQALNSNEFDSEVGGPDGMKGFSFEIPNKIRYFAGRENELLELHNSVLNNEDGAVITAVSGMGGIGKTTLAIHYVRKYHVEFSSNVIWINAETSSSILSSFKRLATKLGVLETQQDSGGEVFQGIVLKVYEQFSQTKSIFVFDNATCLEEIKSYLPSNSDLNKISPNLLITSRNNKWMDKFRTILLDVFTEDEAMMFLADYLKLITEKEFRASIRLVRALEFLPIAIRQAGAYIKVQKEESISPVGLEVIIDEYLRQLQINCKELLDYPYWTQTGEPSEKTTFITWNLTLRKIGGQNQLCKKIMDTIVYLSPSRISIVMLFGLVDEEHRDLRTSKQDSLKSAINLLHQYSIVKKYGDFISVHRLVQTVIRENNKKSEKTKLVQARRILVPLGYFESREHMQSIWEHGLENMEFVKEFPDFGIRACEWIVPILKRDEYYVEKNLDVLTKTIAIFKSVHPTKLVYQLVVMCYKIYLSCGSENPDFKLMSELFETISSNRKEFTKVDLHYSDHIERTARHLVRNMCGSEGECWNTIGQMGCHLYKIYFDVIKSQIDMRHVVRICAGHRDCARAMIKFKRIPETLLYTQEIRELLKTLQYEGDDAPIYLDALRSLAENLVEMEDGSETAPDECINLALAINEELYETAKSEGSDSRALRGLRHKAKCLFLLGDSSSNEKGHGVCNEIYEHAQAQTADLSNLSALLSVSTTFVELGHLEHALRNLKLLKGHLMTNKTVFDKYSNQNYLIRIIGALGMDVVALRDSTFDGIDLEMTSRQKYTIMLNIVIEFLKAKIEVLPQIDVFSNPTRKY